MNAWLLAAAVLTFATGLVHSVLGEWMIFRRLRRGRWVSTPGGDRLGRVHLGILWASWHGMTWLGWSMAAVLAVLAQQPLQAAGRLTAQFIALGMAAGALTVLTGTRGRHPGWIAMGLVALLVQQGW